MKFFISIILSFAITVVNAQVGVIKGSVKFGGTFIRNANVYNANRLIANTDSAGQFTIDGLSEGVYHLNFTAIGFNEYHKVIELKPQDTISLSINLQQKANHIQEVVVSGTLKEVNRLDSPVPVEVYKPSFFKKNPTASIFDALQNVNGVRPQVNCNICNTGDIHINGLEGPYTMVMIDGMPIVSSLSTVYGLSGIPNALVERIEIVKGPASSLYGSEAVGGLINIITKKPNAAPSFSADVFSTTWGELNADVGIKFKLPKQSFLTGISYFNYQNPLDVNKDNFTDVTQQHRISIFEKWSIDRKNRKLFSMAARYLYEDRWGGEMQWNKNYRGGNVIYGESIYTSRWELIGNYQLPVHEKILLSYSLNQHHQNSVYGTTIYNADQKIAFGQLTWDKKIDKHDLLAGTALRFTFYDDSTPATGGLNNKPDRVWLPGVFLQDDFALHANHNLLFGIRYDYNSVHGNILTPRFAWKWKVNSNNVFRFNAGSGFRVVNLFTEDHAALTGAREVVIQGNLRPEKSYNVNLNYTTKVFQQLAHPVNLEIATWLTHFNNRIIADYETDVNKIIYANLEGYAVSKGMSANLDFTFARGVKLISGITLLDVATISNSNGVKVKERQMLTEPWMGTWALTIPIRKLKMSVDYTGNVYGPMRVPTLDTYDSNGNLIYSDPRPKTSPVWSLQNIQLTYNFHQFELYGGVKNLLNWTPSQNTPNIIAGADAPFSDRFDPTYVYAPNQGMRGFLGIRVNVKK